MRWCDVLLSVAAVVMLCGAVRDCGRDEPAVYVPPVMDTLVIVDTVRYYMPVARDSVVVRYATVRVAIDHAAERRGTDSTYLYDCGGLSSRYALALPQKAGEGVSDATGDSVDVELPIVQVHYVDTAYQAWVSGYEPRLDSVWVFPQREVVTVRDSGRRRWGVGVFAGYGVTPRGVVPCAGLCVNYNLWSF